VAGKHGQDARATMNGVTQLEKLIGPAWPAEHLYIPNDCWDNDPIGLSVVSTVIVFPGVRHVTKESGAART
jgi:hypothetical protein